MKISDLKTGYKVRLRNGVNAVVMKDYKGEEDCLVNESYEFKSVLKDYDNDSMRSLYNNEEDIMVVYTGFTKICVYNRMEEIDWSKLKRDALIYVGLWDDNTRWPRYFDYYKAGKVYVFPQGTTSFTSVGDSVGYDIGGVDIDKLRAKDWDWSKVKTNDLVSVKDGKVWKNANFIGFLDDKVFVYIDSKDGYGYSYFEYARVMN